MENTELPLTRPTYTPPRLLSDLLVRNRKTLERIVTLGRENAAGSGRHHLLLVGPPGCGKTHILSLALARLERGAPPSRRPLVARLPEIPWGITTFADLLLRALEALPRKGKEGLRGAGDPGGTRDVATAARLLKEAAGKRTLLLVVENLDQVFGALGEEGRREFRAFLQQDSFTAVLATSRRLFDEVTRRNSPFYGFFRVEHMEPLDSRAALNLAGKILEKFASRAGKGPASRPETASWIRAVQHVSRGNARCCLLFALGLARGDSYGKAFLDTLDRIGPLHVEETLGVSPQQRKILDYLARRGGAVQVKEIARACLATEQTVSAQLRELRKPGLVAATRAGRNSFYEVSDPLLRLYLDLRRGGASRVLERLAFLSHWYRPGEKDNFRLREILRPGPGEGKWERALPALLEDSGKKGALLELGVGLVRSLGDLFSSPLAEEAGRTWVETWKAKASSLRELAFPLRLLEGGFQEGLAPRSPAFMALPLEGREILRPLLPG